MGVTDSEMDVGDSWTIGGWVLNGNGQSQPNTLLPISDSQLSILQMYFDYFR